MDEELFARFRMCAVDVLSVPEDKVVPYFVVLIIVFIVIGFVIATIAGMAIPAPVRGF